MGDYVDRGIYLYYIKVITVLRLSLFLLPSKSDIKIELLFWEEIMSQDKSLKSMDFMTNVVENTATVMFGKHLLNFSIIFHSPLSLKIHSSVFTEDFHLQLKLLITFVLWKEFKKFHMKDQCVIFCGQILMIVQDGEWIQEALVTLSVKTLLKVSITLITWKWLLVHISWWWRYFF